MSRNKRSLLMALVWLAAVAAIGFLGNRAGHVMARAGYFRDAAQGPQTAAATRGTDGSGKPQRQRTQAVPARVGAVDAAMEKLRLVSRNYGDVLLDWETQGAISGILEDLSTQELAELFARLETEDDTGGMNDVAKMVGVRWAASDPDAAIHAALAKSKTRGEYFALSIFRDWAADHTREALAWLDTAELDPRLQERKDDMRAGIVQGMAERDFTLAKEELAKLGEKSAREVMQSWGVNYVEDAAMREKLIEYAKSTGRPADFAAMNGGLVRAWPENDPLGLMNHLQDLQDYLESDAVPAAARPEVDAAAVGIAIQREYHEAALEWWMARYSQSSEAPKPLREAMNTWSRQKPEVAAQWLAAQPESPQRDALSGAAVSGFIGKNNFPKAAEIIELISDSELRQPAVERLEILWKEADPAAAKEWKDLKSDGD